MVDHLSARDRAGQAEAFDAIVGRYDEAFPDKAGQLAAGEWLTDALPRGAAVLDLGSGTGVPTALQLSDAGLRVVGVDLSAGMVEQARANVPAAEFHHMDLADVGRLGATFDAVTAFFSLLMLPRAEFPGALATIRSLLPEGGLFALAMVDGDADDVPLPFLGGTIRVSAYPRAELRALIADAGFEILDEADYTYEPDAADVHPEVQVFLHCRRR